MRILIVEDDPSLAQALYAVLRHHGHSCVRVDRGEQLLAQHRDFDAVLLDLQLADGDGFTVLHELRQRSDLPVLIVTARGDERSTLRALHLGADDYLVKPVRMRELIARLDTVTRRRVPELRQGRITCADIVIDIDARTVEVAGKPIHLTTKEFDLLAVLAKRAGQAVHRQQILDEVWGNALVSNSRSFDVHLTQLRSKFGRSGAISTIRGFGYRLEA